MLLALVVVAGLDQVVGLVPVELLVVVVEPWLLGGTMDGMELLAG